MKERMLKSLFGGLLLNVSPICSWCVSSTGQFLHGEL